MIKVLFRGGVKLVLSQFHSFDMYVHNDLMSVFIHAPSNFNFDMIV